MWRWLGVALLLEGCVGPAVYYCTEVQLHLKDGRDVEALECLPRERKLPTQPQPGKAASAEPGREGLHAGPPASGNSRRPVP